MTTNFTPNRTERALIFSALNAKVSYCRAVSEDRANIDENARVRYRHLMKDYQRLATFYKPEKV